MMIETIITNSEVIKNKVINKVWSCFERYNLKKYI